MTSRLAHATVGALFVLAGCLGDRPPQPRATVAVAVAALDLHGVGDVVWDVEVDNGATPPQVVWQRRLASSRYGDGGGSASYVGPCDAAAGADLNSVKVWVVGVYSAPVTALGTFAAGAAGGVTGSALPFEDPTAGAPLTRTVTCVPNADAAVRFDVALMRPATQGFFDIAVSFDDLFCSAKFDCCGAGARDGCDPQLDGRALLFDEGGARGPTMVLGFACTGGAREDGDTVLYLDALELDCTAPTDFTTGFTTDIALDPSTGPGNACTAGAMSSCPAVLVGAGLVDDYLFQLGTYRGSEALTSGGVSAQKVYWNVALGVELDAIGDCWLRTRGTADDANETPIVDHGVVTAGAVYPYVRWELELATCGAEQLQLGDPDASVRAAYTGVGDGPTAFAYGYGRSQAAGSFCGSPCLHGLCVSGACVCDDGYEGPTCALDTADCFAGACGGAAAGTCVDGVASYTCDCNDGYYGDGTTSCALCDPVVNCTAVTCTGAGASVCTACVAGYEGPTCENDIDDCVAGSCGGATAGTCVDGVASFTCDCNDGYHGDGTTTCTPCDAVAFCAAVTCTGAGASTCTACADGYELIGGACVEPASGSSCGASGASGPTQAACDAAYAGTPLAGQITVTSGYQRWTVPTTGTYRLTARGAEGGSLNTLGTPLVPGGLGAEVSGEFGLTAGDVLVILVGQRGGSRADCSGWGAGGGGGTFITKVVPGGDVVSALGTTVGPLLIAGGGAGASNQLYAGSDCATPPDPADFDGRAGTLTGATGGNDGWGGGGGGGGYLDAGRTGSSPGGGSFVGGGVGGAGGGVSGGFGGGGGPYNDGGGGGGYTGGRGDQDAPPDAAGHNGGFSYNAGVNRSGADGVNAGNGSFEIQLLDTPACSPGCAAPLACVNGACRCSGPGQPETIDAGMLSASNLTAFDAGLITNGALGDDAWHVDSSPAGAWLEVNYGAARALSQLRVWSNYAPSIAPNYPQFDVEYFDGSSWQKAARGFVRPWAGWNAIHWPDVGAHARWRLWLSTPALGPWLDDVQAQVCPSDARGGDVQRTCGPPTTLQATMLTATGLVDFSRAMLVNGVYSEQGWSTDGAPTGSTLNVNLGSGNAKALRRARIWREPFWWHNGVFDVEYSDDNSAWHTAAADFSLYSPGWNGISWPSVGAHRYWRLRLVSATTGTWLDDVELYECD